MSKHPEMAWADSEPEPRLGYPEINRAEAAERRAEILGEQADRYSRELGEANNEIAMLRSRLERIRSLLPTFPAEGYEIFGTLVVNLAEIIDLSKAPDSDIGREKP